MMWNNAVCRFVALVAAYLFVVSCPLGARTPSEPLLLGDERSNLYLPLLEGQRVDRRTRGTILVNAATGLVAFGEAGRAMPLYEEALSCYRAVLPEGDYLFAALYNNMASAWSSLGDRDRAEKCMLRALDVLKALSHHADLATTYVNLAQFYAFDGRAEEADRCLNAAMEAFDDPEMVWDGYYAHTAQKCAGAFASLGRKQEASELRERVKLIYEGT